jgi:cupin fold WbuC family metalloprotein
VIVTKVFTLPARPSSDEGHMSHENPTPRNFDAAYFDRLCAAAAASPRRRQHDNLHADSAEPCQRLFNAIGEDSYIPPHRHLVDPKTETLVAVRGKCALLLFDDTGHVTAVQPFGIGLDAVAVELRPEVWHTVIAMTPQAVLFETKAGPFDAARAKELAAWAPEEGGASASAYLRRLRVAAVAGC